MEFRIIPYFNAKEMNEHLMSQAIYMDVGKKRASFH